VFVLSACGDDGSSVFDDVGSAEAGAVTGAGTGASETGAVDTSGGGTLPNVDDSGGNGSTSMGTEGTEGSSTGAPAIQPQAEAQFVGAGRQASSQTYHLNFTFGQPTINQGIHASQLYRLRGGLSGAMGDTP